MKKYRIPAILLAVILLFGLLSGGLADFGSFSGDSDYGSSSSWSSSSSDWGSSSSWSSGSSDWGSGSSWSTGSGFGSGYVHTSPGYSSYSGGGFYFGGGTLFIIFVIVVIIIIASRSKHSSSSGYTVPAGAERTPQSKLTDMSGYTALDPNFSEDRMREWVGNLYVEMQNAWTGKDISPLRPYFTDALYNQYARQVEMFKANAQTNFVERISVLGTDLRGYYQQEGYDHIIVETRTRIVDYTVDDNTGEVISGSKTAEKFMTYEWDITRKSGITTKLESEVRTVNCPNCGAPLSINTTTVCPYCDSVVTVNNEDWAIVSLKGISQRTNR